MNLQKLNTDFLNAHARKLFFYAHTQPIIDHASTLWDSASANTLKPLVSIHKRTLKLTLLKSTSLTAHDYKLLDVLPLKLKLEFNKGIILYKIVSDYPPSNLKLNFHSNQNRHSHKLVVPRPRLDLFKCSLIYSGGNLWNNLPLSIKIISDRKAFKNKNKTKTPFKQYLMEKKSQQTLIKDMCTIFLIYFFNMI